MATTHCIIKWNEINLSDLIAAFCSLAGTLIIIWQLIITRREFKLDKINNHLTFLFGEIKYAVEKINNIQLDSKFDYKTGELAIENTRYLKDTIHIILNVQKIILLFNDISTKNKDLLVNYMISLITPSIYSIFNNFMSLHYKIDGNIIPQDSIPDIRSYNHIFLEAKYFLKGMENNGTVHGKAIKLGLFIIAPNNESVYKY